jgi:hypothetical protein
MTTDTIGGSTDSTEVSLENKGDEMFDFLGAIFGFGDEPKSKGVRIPLQVFLKSYVDIARKGGNSVDVANELGISPQAVRQRAGKLLRQGVKLPKLGNICRRDSAAEANEIIEAL